MGIAASPPSPLRERRGVPARTQVFASRTRSPKLVIELDGMDHRTDLRSCVHDELLAADGYTVLRFAHREVLETSPP